MKLTFSRSCFTIRRIFTLPKLGSKVKMDSTPLTYTPRKISFHPSQQYLYVAESDHRTLSAPATSEKLNGLVRVVVSCQQVTDRLTVSAARQENAEQYMVPPEQFGLPRAEAGNWGSCIRAVNAMIPAEDATTAQVHLDNNEAAFSMAVVQFASRENELHLVVGTAKDTTVMPRTCSSGYIRVYQITNDGAGLELMHVVSRFVHASLSVSEHLSINWMSLFRLKWTKCLHVSWLSKAV